MKLKKRLDAIVKNAFEKAGIDAEPIGVNEATKPEFGDYQFNGAMALAKRLKANPREIAARIAEHLNDPLIAETEIAGPGFINIRLDDKALASALNEARQDARLGVALKSEPQKVVVDYSGPNMAKQMHVGHLRSTIIGDAIANVLEFLGDEVIRQNHIGDWGTQFGMLIAYLEERGGDGEGTLSDLEQFYKDAKKRFDEDEAFANKAREYVVKIQSGDAHCLGLWKRFIDISLRHCEEVYDKLNVKLTRDDVRAESFYNDKLAEIVETLQNEGVAQLSEGAVCVFLEGEEAPLIVRKADGGYLYATTDLAALWYRANVLGAKRIMYVVDARQSQHFKQVFETARKAGLVGEDVVLEHIAFGTMMDKNGKPFKTREGGTVKLIDLLDEAVSRAKEAIKQSASYDEEELERIAEAVGIGAVKYADLSIDRKANYIFDWDKMLSFEGNTALYMQYAYARIRSIFRKYDGALTGEIEIGDALEHRLALQLLRFEDVLTQAAQKAMPSFITGYLYDLATLFMKFYERNPILKEDVDEATRQSRLALADATAKTIKEGLALLGIKVVERL
jgi:arginyl-tRNA synthetase